MHQALLEEITSRFDHVRYWEPSRVPSGQSAQPGGRTALAVLALIDSGIPAQREDVAAALDALQEYEIKGTYAIAARLMAFVRLPDERLFRARADVRLLMDSFDPDGGGWDYGPNPRTHLVDQSLTQFATLALAEASERGINVPAAIFHRVRQRFLRLQGVDGGWGYRASGPSRGSMTAAGLATLALCERHAPSDPRTNTKVNEAMTRAIAWLDAEFTAEANPGHARWIDYWLLSLERAARATGFQTFSGKRWLQHGAASIARRLLSRRDGEWRMRGGREAGIEKLCFATMFMRRSQEPIAVGLVTEQAEHEPGTNLSNLSRQVGHEIEEKIGWARLTTADPESAWENCPLLVLRIDSEFPLETISREGVIAQRLRWCARRGSTIVICAPRPGTRIRGFVRAMGGWLLPEESWNTDRHEGLPRAVESIGTPGRRWLYFLPGIDPTTDSQRKQATAMSCLCAIWHATTRGRPWPRLPAAREHDELPITHESVAFVRCRHEGNWLPEPGAERVLEQRLAARGIGCVFPVAEEGPPSSNVILRVCGHTPGEAESSIVDRLHAHCAGGGVAVIESIGGGAFAPALARALAARLGGRVLPLAPPEGTKAWPTNIACISREGRLAAIVFIDDVSGILLGRTSDNESAAGEVINVFHWLATRELDRRATR